MYLLLRCDIFGYCPVWSEEIVLCVLYTFVYTLRSFLSLSLALSAILNVAGSSFSWTYVLARVVHVTLCCLDNFRIILLDILCHPCKFLNSLLWATFIWLDTCTRRASIWLLALLTVECAHCLLALRRPNTVAWWVLGVVIALYIALTVSWTAHGCHVYLPLLIFPSPRWVHPHLWKFDPFD